MARAASPSAMRPARVALALALALAFALAGCTARGSKPDPFAYTRVPIYAGAFDLAAAPHDEQSFRVEDGSLSSIHARVWVNATTGGALVKIVDPSGDVVWSADRTADATLTSDLGTWKVLVDGVASPDGPAAGSVSVLVTRR
jgi:hypothetical protein